MRISKMARPNTVIVAFVIFAALGSSVSRGGVVIKSTYLSQHVPGTYISDSQVNGAVTSYTINAATLAGAGFSAAGSDKLVLSISTKWASEDGGAVTSLTYNGTALTKVFGKTYLRSRQEIWYLDNVASDGDIDLGFSFATEGFAIYIFALKGTKPGTAQDEAYEAGGDGILPNLTTTVANSFVLWEVSDNRGTPGYSGTYSSNAQLFGGRGGSRALWNIEAAPGTFSETVTGDRDDTGQVGAVFEAAPPSGTVFIFQ